MGIFLRENEWFLLKSVFFEEKMHDLGDKWGISEEKTRDFLVKWKIPQEKRSDFHLNGGFPKRNRVFFAKMGDLQIENVPFSG